jgi:hypothetical protein
VASFNGGVLKAPPRNLRKLLRLIVFPEPISLGRPKLTRGGA